MQRTLSPKWDLSLVLSLLCKAPYEPLHKASMLYLTMKIAFLLAMASAKRVSEIHALSMDREHLRFSDADGSLIIRTQPGFFAKNQLPSRSSQSIYIPCLTEASTSNGFNRKLCPVRALTVLTGSFVQLELLNATLKELKRCEVIDLACLFLLRDHMISLNHLFQDGLSSLYN